MIATGILLPSSIVFGQDPNGYPQPNVDQNQVDQNPDVRVARIGLIEDHVSFQRGDDDEWYDATLNTPVQTGDRLYTGDGGRMELQLDGLYVRLDKKTALDVLDLSSHISQFRLITGTATINLHNQPAQPFEIDTPGGAVTLQQRGDYRINVFENGRVEVLVVQGQAEVYNDGRSVTLQDNRRITIDGTDVTSQDVTALPSKDAWDVWNDLRDSALAQADSTHYVDQPVSGVEDLDRYGTWNNTPDYGYTWTPTVVEADWAPYQDGRWCWRDPYGWTWVSYEPWGWAPYHYGRWLIIGGRWCWVPGPRLGFYSPSLVGFIGFGGGRFIGWVPLAPRDPFFPWWRIGRPYYGYNAFYINQRFRNSVTIINRENFIGGFYRRDRVVYNEGLLRDGRSIVGPGILPTRASLAVGAARPNLRPDLFSRTVVARNNSVPVVRRFSDNMSEIRARGGAPVSPFQTANGRIETRAVRGNTGAVVRGNGFEIQRGSQINTTRQGTNDRPTRAIDRPFVPPQQNSIRPSRTDVNRTPQVQSNHNTQQVQSNHNVDRTRDNGSSRNVSPRRDNQIQSRPTRSVQQSRSYSPPPSRSSGRSYSPPAHVQRSSGGSSGGGHSSGRSSSSSHSSGSSSHSSGGSGHHR